MAVSNEGVRVRPVNLTPVRKQPATDAPPVEAEEDMDTGVYVNMTIGDKTVAVEPGTLKKQFEAVVARYSLYAARDSNPRLRVQPRSTCLLNLLAPVSILTQQGEGGNG